MLARSNALKRVRRFQVRAADWFFGDMKTVGATLKALFIGRARDLSDQRLFHKLSLIAVLAWVGLGADGLSSSCYGPEETFKALGAHSALSVFVALGCVLTIAVICASYRQIIELFPSGGEHAQRGMR